MAEPDPLDEILAELGITPRGGTDNKRTSASEEQPGDHVHATRHAAVRERYQVPQGDGNTPGERFTVWFTPVGGPSFTDDTVSAVISAFAHEKAGLVGDVAVETVTDDTRGGVTVTYIKVNPPQTAAIGVGPVMYGSGILTVADRDMATPALAAWVINDGARLGEGGEVGASFDVHFFTSDGGPFANNEFEGAVERAMGELTREFGTLGRTHTRPGAKPHSRTVTFTVVGTHEAARSPVGVPGGDMFDIAGRAIIYTMAVGLIDIAPEYRRMRR